MIKAREKEEQDMASAKKKRLLILLAAFAAAAAVVLALFYSGMPLIPCVFNKLTGLKCPGCGNTRAASALAHLQFAQSFSYNYAYPLEFLYLLHVLFSACRKYVNTGRFSYYPKHPAADWAVLAAVLVWWVLRNVLHV